MINCKEITVEENIRLNTYINALEGSPKLLDCEKLFEYLRILQAKYGKTVTKSVNKINIKILRPAITYIWTKHKFTLEYRNRAFDLSKKSLLFSARDDFDSFMLYTEIDRPSGDKFWQPRRNSKLKVACEALQELADDKIDVLFMACPPRVDFMDNVAQQLGIYWDEVDTNTLTKILVGIFGMANCPDFVNNHTYNISGKSGDEAKFGVTTLNTAVQRALGDNKAKFALAIMHSMISTNLENQQLINFLKYTDKDGVQRDLSIGTLNGRIVLIDDGVPHYDAITTAEVKGTYTLAISTAFAKDEKVTIDGVEYKCVEGTPGENEFKGADKNAQATSLVSALNRNLLDFIATAASGTITFTQRVGGVGAKPTASTTATTGAIGSVTNGTAGVAEVKETVYTTYVFGEGAFEYCDVGAKVPYEMARDAAKNGGETTLYGRKRKVFAPKGISFVGNPATSSPTDAELSDGANWDIVNNGKTGADKKYIDHRAIAICRIISKG